MFKLFKLMLMIAVTCVSGPAFGEKFEGLAKTPPMGWNSWNHFECKVDEKLIRETAKAMVDSGMKAAGYEYVIIDDCWHEKERAADGSVIANKERFPSGMKALADYIHGLGLKFGIYSDAGFRTCAGYPGSRGYEYQDARTYAEWGVDYLKYDWCETKGLNGEGAYLTMREALYKAGRPVVLSICEWGHYKPWDGWGKEMGHLWRTTGDITNCWDCEVDHGTWSSWGILRVLDMQDGLRKSAGPDGWNDPDMLEVGNGMSINEDRAHFSMWVMLAAPLIAGNDLRNMKPETVAILTNPKAIAINQDSLGIQGFRYKKSGDMEIWAKPLNNGDWAITFLNRGVNTQRVSFNWKRENLADELSKRELNVRTTTYAIDNIWNDANPGTTENAFSANVGARDAVMLRLSPTQL